MSKGIIRNSDSVEVADFVLSRWDVVYNSKSYIGIELIFNSNLNTIFADYNSINGTSGFNALNVFIRDSNNLSAPEIQLIKNGSVYTTNGVNGNFDNTYVVSPSNNSLRFNYNPVGFLDVSKDYVVVVRLNQDTISGGVDFEREIIFNDTFNLNYADATNKRLFRIKEVSVPTGNTLLDFSTSPTIKLNAYSIESIDNITLSIKGQSNGITSGNATSINNSSGTAGYFLPPTYYYGYVYNSVANFPFTVSPLAQTPIFNIDQTKKLQLRLNSTAQVFDIDYTSIKCYSDKVIDSTYITEYPITVANTVFIPVMKDVPSDNMVATFKDGAGNSGKLSISSGNINAVTTSPVVATNGTFTFNTTYDTGYFGTNGTAWGTLEIKNSSNNIILTKSVNFQVIQNDLPIITITNPLNGNSFMAGSGINFNVNASDSIGGIQKVDFYIKKDIDVYTTPIGTDTTPSPYSIPVDTFGYSSGTYNCKAIATDNYGLTTTSAEITISIT